MHEFGFHPLIGEWFRGKFAGPTEPQRRGWPVIATGRDVLIAAPTGSGKTLTAFLAIIDRLFREAQAGTLTDKIRVVYVSPLRALSNDMQRNLSEPLAEIAELAAKSGLEVPPLRVGLRTGDTTASQRAALLRKPPQVLVTTPESLYLLLTTEKGREALADVSTLIVDEIHALVRDKRGSHLALTMERLQALVGRPIQRIGLSATQKPLERIGEFLVGGGAEGIPKPPATIVDAGHQRHLDLAIDTPMEEIGPVCTHEQWAVVHQRLGELIQSHRSTLIFVNTRRMAERLTHALSEVVGAEHISSHHGSLSTEIRQQTEYRLKTGDLKAVVATASLELGLDVGYIDLVVQLGSPRSIATFLQRIGRSGHSLQAIPKGRIIALTRDELLECMALIRAIRQGILDEVRIPIAPLDVLAQQIVAETACDEWDAEELWKLCRRAWPFRELTREVFEQTLQFLSEGITSNSGRSRSLIYYDRIGKRIKARPIARSTAIGNAGAIPETGSYRVVAQPENTVIGSVDEDFAVESTRGDIFLLGNTSWQIEHVRHGDVVVHDAHGAPPTIPFWFGEAPGRTIELSTAVSDLREEIALRAVDPPAAIEWLVEETTCPEAMAGQIVDYARSQVAAIGLVPAQKKVVFERFFDESGGMQLVVHAPFGAPITRAWGYAMRKRFCRSFDFELQATADDDGFILSLGPQHSFPLESLFGMLTSENVENLLSQAILVQPPFQLRWRWNVTRALLVSRTKFGKKVPPALQRFRSEDLLTSVFPQLTGCQENHTGDIELPDHPLLNQTMHDCLHEAMDLDGLKRVLRQIEAGDIQLIARDTREPSPFCYEILNAAPYAFLDGGEIQERRARVVSPGSELTPDMPSLEWLDPVAIGQVVAEALPWVRDRDELHDLLLAAGMLPVELPRETGLRPVAHPEIQPDWIGWFQELKLERRAIEFPLSDGRTAWSAVERFPAIQAIYSDVVLPTGYAVPAGVRTDWDAVSARMFVTRGWLEFCGPVTSAELAAHFTWPEPQTAAILEALEGEGTVMRGRYREGRELRVQSLQPDNGTHASGGDSSSPWSLNSQPSTLNLPLDWCHRRLLARIHRRTLAGLRQQVEPVDVAAFQRFLFEHHGVTGDQRSGVNGLFEVLSQLQGLDLSALAWEQDILPARLQNYDPAWFDELCLTGEAGWGRLYPPKSTAQKPAASLTRVVPISLFLRADLGWLQRREEKRPSSAESSSEGESLSSLATEICERLEAQGASFATDLMATTRMLPTHLEEALGELISRGIVTADTFTGLRSLIAERKEAQQRGRDRVPAGYTRQRLLTNVSGRWSIWKRSSSVIGELSETERLQAWAWQLLRRWGVVFRDLIAQEDGSPRWWELVPVFRRLEARGEVRGGRFITGVAGEQFALESSLQRLRRHREPSEGDGVVLLSAVDPLNLIGVLSPPPRIPSQAQNRVLYVHGVPTAALQGGEVIWLAIVNEKEQRRYTALLKGLEPWDFDDPHTSRKRRTPVKRAEYPNQPPRPLIS